MEQIEIFKWQGIRNDETKKVSQGYLYLKFLSDIAMINTNPNVVNAKLVNYSSGKIIGFSISNVANKREAIKKFFSDHKIIGQ